MVAIGEYGVPRECVPWGHGLLQSAVLRLASPASSNTLQMGGEVLYET